MRAEKGDDWQKSDIFAHLSVGQANEGGYLTAGKTKLAAKLLRDGDSLKGVQPTDILETKQLLNQRLTFEPRLGVIDCNAARSSDPFLNHLVTIAVIAQKNTKTIGGLVDFFKPDDIHIILR